MGSGRPSFQSLLCLLRMAYSMRSTLLLLVKQFMCACPLHHPASVPLIALLVALASTPSVLASSRHSPPWPPHPVLPAALRLLLPRCSRILLTVLRSFSGQSKRRKRAFQNAAKQTGRLLMKPMVAYRSFHKFLDKARLTHFQSHRRCGT